ncbi:uncharacterized protein LOC124235206 [Equus quagga]|uniref:uncharacterized protein LOC124235206 n=1 Tax=Equus quagga TaxID=89248 RepID=UPI001EE2294A|nr:uncharacterized protein LOC124235206 [Equus quagga]
MAQPLVLGEGIILRKPIWKITPPSQTSHQGLRTEAEEAQERLCQNCLDRSNPWSSYSEWATLGDVTTSRIPDCLAISFRTEVRLAAPPRAPHRRLCEDTVQEKESPPAEGDIAPLPALISPSPFALRLLSAQPREMLHYACCSDGLIGSCCVKLDWQMSLRAVQQAQNHRTSWSSFFSSFTFTVLFSFPRATGNEQVTGELCIPTLFYSGLCVICKGTEI